MFRKFSLVTLALIVLGTAPVDAQLFRRVRSAIQKVRDSSSDLQRQNQLAEQQKREPEDSGKQSAGAIRPAQRGSAPTLAKRPTSNSEIARPQSKMPQSATESEATQKFGIFVDGRTGRRFRRPIESAPDPSSPPMAKPQLATPARPNAASSIVGQFDIARQAAKQVASNDPLGAKSNQSVLKDSKVIRASNAESSIANEPKETKIKKSFSILEPRESAATEPEKPKPVTLPELNKPEVIK